MLNWKLADTLPGLGLEPAEVDISAFELSRAVSGSRTSFIETSMGTASLILVQHLRRPSEATRKRLKDAAPVVEDAIQLAVGEVLDNDGCEVLYGRAGLLYCLLYLRTQLSAIEGSSGNDVRATITKLSSDGNISLLVNDIVARGRWGAIDYARELPDGERQLVPALMWTWHGKRYLGAAHGVGECVS